MAHDPRLHAGAGVRADAAPRPGCFHRHRAVWPAPAGRGDDDLLYAFGAAQRSRAFHRRRARRLRLGGDPAEGDAGLMRSLLMVRRRTAQRADRVQVSPPQSMPTQPSTLNVSGPDTEMLLA